MLRPEMNLPERSEFSSQALLLIRFQILYFSQIPEWNKDPASRISVPFYPGNSEFFPVFLNSSSFRQIRICLVLRMTFSPQFICRRFPVFCVRPASVAQIVYAFRILIVCVYSSGIFDQLSQAFRILQHGAGAQMVIVKGLIVVVCLEDGASQRIQQ